MLPMGFRHQLFFTILKNNAYIIQNLRQVSTVSNLNVPKVTAHKFKTEHNLVYLEDPDNFGTLSGMVIKTQEIPEDDGDLAEEKFLQNIPSPNQKLTTKQYADLIKQYVKHKRLKEAINVLEVRMLTEDRVKPENYIYNLLIGACAQVGYTKKAFKLYNDMKRRNLKVTGDTYTCLFNACANSPWSGDGLNNARHLKQLMIEKGVEPNLTNYNVMIKAFGRCGDLSAAFQIVDEMISKKIKIRVHTFNFLLQACISDKNTGLRHALIVWRKMLKMREKPNIYSFNLMLKCVKECNLGSKQDIEELIEDIQKNSLPDKRQVFLKNTDHLSPPSFDNEKENNNVQLLEVFSNSLSTELKTAPNLISKNLNIEEVMSLKEVHTLQDKFAVIGREVYFLKEMQIYKVPPNIKTFTQMLQLIEETADAEIRLINIMKALGVKTDISFYNMLIQRRCMRNDHEGALEVKKMIEEESKYRKKRYPLKKKLRLKPNIMTYGVLAMGCDTKDKAENMLQEINEKGLKVNIEIMGALLQQATFHSRFGYVLFIMNTVRDENLRINDVFMKHLIAFNEKCEEILKIKDGKRRYTKIFEKSHGIYKLAYEKWLKEVNTEEALQKENPWKQFQTEQPESVQRQKLIEEPKRFIKRRWRPSVFYKP